MMIRIAHSSGKHGGIDLSGTPAELRDVGERVKQFLASAASTLNIHADSESDPTPYDRSLRELVFRKAQGPTRIQATPDGAMVVEGGPAALEVFAANFGFPDGIPEGHHCHYEYFDGDDRIDPTSTPLVIRVRRAAEEKWLQAIAVILLSVISAVVYGVVHDQITARVCVEYFTVGHRPVFTTADPTLLALGWGVIATWWVGVLLGVPLAVAARAGGRPKRSAGSLVRPILIPLLVMAGSALLAGVVGYALARNGSVSLLEPMASAVPGERHARFLADLWAHLASYLAGFLGGIVLIVLTWRSRRPCSKPEGR